MTSNTLYVNKVRVKPYVYNTQYVGYHVENNALVIWNRRAMKLELSFKNPWFSFVIAIDMTGVIPALNKMY